MLVRVFDNDGLTLNGTQVVSKTELIDQFYLVITNHGMDGVMELTGLLPTQSKYVSFGLESQAWPGPTHSGSEDFVHSCPD